MRKLLPIMLLLSLCSCTAISSLVHDDQVVARVGKYKLYRSQLDSYIPDYVSREDSTNLAMQYINTWAKELLYLNVAQEQLSKGEMDVSSELEAYRRSLLKYRYEQHYIADRLDTLVTQEQLAAYYNEHLESFRLVRPVLKVRFLDIMKDSPNLEVLEKDLSSEDDDVRAMADSLMYSSALKYLDLSSTWTDAMVLAKEFGVDYVTMLSAMDGSYIRITPEDRDDIKIAYVCDIRRSGIAPLEFCEERISDIILSVRKRDLVDSLERDLLESALERKQFVIFNQ